MSIDFRLIYNLEKAMNLVGQPKLLICSKLLDLFLRILACWMEADDSSETRTKSGKYGPRVLWPQFYMSQGRLYVSREVDLADKTLGAQRREWTYIVILVCLSCIDLVTVSNGPLEYSN